MRTFLFSLLFPLLFTLSANGEIGDRANIMEIPLRTLASQREWQESEWLGWFVDYEGIFYHAEHGWWQLPGELASSLYLNDFTLKLWGWTSRESYPWIYFFSPVNSWTYYSLGGHPNERWFFHMGANEWRKQDNLKDSYDIPLDAMALIPAGEVHMGDHFGDGGAWELPVHTVFVDEFYIQKTEVTILQWDSVIEWSRTYGYDLEDYWSPKFTQPDYPVNGITWYEAVKFCNAMSEKDGFTPVYWVDGKVYRSGQIHPRIDYSVNGYRLPTEAEWEKAASGKLEGKRFPWGDEIDHGKAIYRANSTLYPYDKSGYAEDTSHPTWGEWIGPVGSFPGNGYGLFDMAGNVYEFCNDYYQSNYYSLSPAIDPRGPESGINRAFRGGSYLQRAISCRIASRAGTTPEYTDWQFGFRLAQSIEN